MPRTFAPTLLVVLVGRLVTPSASSANCTNNTIGTGNHKVCAVLGSPCEDKSGSCITILIPKEDTQGGDCICIGTSVAIPNDSTFFLYPVGGILPQATGHATVRWLPDGRRAAAIGLRGLTPSVSYQVFTRTGLGANCSSGTQALLGLPVVADGLGNAVVIEQTPSMSPISVREAGGAQRIVLCGPSVGIPGGVPASSPWTVAMLAIALASLSGMGLLRQRMLAPESSKGSRNT
jgi:hypothetical protein